MFLDSESKASGYLEFKKARVRWYLSIDANDLPDEVKNRDVRTFRSIKVDNKEFEFSVGFTDLHNLSYEQILSGNGFKLDEARQAIDTVHKIRHSEIKSKVNSDYHPILNKL